MSGIQMALLGTGGDIITLVGGDFSVFDTAPNSVSAGYRLTLTGTEEGGTGPAGSIAYNNLGDWVIPTSNASLYEVRATLNSGSLATGTTGTWLALTSTRTWTVTRINLGLSDADLTIEIRLVGGTAVLASAGVTLAAQLV